MGSVSSSIHQQHPFNITRLISSMKFDLRKIISSKLWSEDTSSNLGSRKLKRPKIHKYVEAHNEQAFVIDPFDENLDLYTMTSQRARVKLSDYILIQDKSGSKTYKILEIDYYCDRSLDMWIAKLVLVNTFDLSETL